MPDTVPRALQDDVPTALHDDFLSRPAARAADTAWLERRRCGIHARARDRCTGPAGETAEAEALWAARSYPVLAVLAPVMSTHEEKIEFPGDPMCLYTALSHAIARIAEVRASGALTVDGYNDFCPALGRLPSPDYRLRAPEGAVRFTPEDLAAGELTTDQCVFDPRVWNARAETCFRERVLRVLRPRAVLISTVSPGHRYALAMARVVKEELPDCLVVLGGRHVDETVRYDPRARRVRLAPSSPLVADRPRGSLPVDLLCAGEGSYALDLLLRAVSLACDPFTGVPSTDRTVAALELLARHEKEVRGSALILALGTTDGRRHAFPLDGERIALESLPAPYAAFAVRARFPVFTRPDGAGMLTAHMMLTNACPYHCNFCSEGALVVGGLKRFPRHAVTAAVERVAEYVSYGAESLFFDDSILWAGDFTAVRAFCAELSALRTAGPGDALPGARLLRTPAERDRLRALKWGEQFTVDSLTGLRSPGEVRETLAALRAAGCTYAYVGIESLAPEVMRHIHKNLRPDAPESWEERVRAALTLLRGAGIEVGSSVLFGLEGETRATIDHTIAGVSRLIRDGLLSIASPNILTYHPGTPLTRQHGMADRLDYHSPDVESRPPYTYFEEAFPGVVSRALTEEDIWHIHRAAQAAWGGHRNSQPMAETAL
ncbi:B12-binding domain-containing radical SAM protein [Streptomyces sp. NPDC086023]|uniref:B12-binding domain-containing radical SAM protein n=1 Tax=Streptomyces sp. NPDC086023 TaxID=3365746 RepID=UPI0037D0E609